MIYLVKQPSEHDWWAGKENTVAVILKCEGKVKFIIRYLWTLLYTLGTDKF